MQDNSARLTVIHDVRQVSISCELDLNMRVSPGKSIQVKSDLLAQLVLIPQETGIFEEGISTLPLVTKTSYSTFIVTFNEAFSSEDDALVTTPILIKFLKFSGVVVVPSSTELKLEVEVSEL